VVVGGQGRRGERPQGVERRRVELADGAGERAEVELPVRPEAHRRGVSQPGVAVEALRPGESGEHADATAVGGAVDGDVAVEAAGDGHERAVRIDRDVVRAERRHDRPEHAAPAGDLVDRERRTPRRLSRRPSSATTAVAVPGTTVPARWSPGRYR
jgi:hypothetical protein